MKGDIYVSMDGVWMTTTMEQIKQIYEKKQALQTRMRRHRIESDICYTTYARESAEGHLIKHHHGICDVHSVDGCTTYCAAGFSKCVICGADNYDQTYNLNVPCSGRPDIILLGEDKTNRCPKCESISFSAFHKIRKWQNGISPLNGYMKDFLQSCVFCMECNAILTEDTCHYFENGAMKRYESFI